MQSFGGIIYDEFIDDVTSTRYSSVTDMADLANGRQIGLVAVCNQATAHAISVDLEHSADGLTFVSKGGSLLISAPLGAGTSVLSGGELLRPEGEVAAAVPSLRYVRLAIALTPDPLTGVGAARVRIFCSVRGSKPVDLAALEAAPPHAASVPGSLERHARIITELQAVADEARQLPARERARFFLARVTPAHIEHFREIDRQLLALGPSTRRLLARTTAALMQHAIDVTGTRQPKAPCCATQPSAQEACACAPGSKR